MGRRGVSLGWLRVSESRSGLPVCVLASLLALAGCEEQPQHMGRKLSSWAHDLEAESAHKRRQAAEALGEMGGKAVKAHLQTLVGLLDDVNQGVQMTAAEALAKLPPEGTKALVEQLQRPEPFQRMFAAAALAEANPEHEKALDTLVKTLSGVGNAELSKRAANHLVDLGEAAVPDLLAALKTNYEPVRLKVIDTLGRIGEPAGTAVEPLAALAADADEAVKLRTEALEALAQIGPASKVATHMRALLEAPTEKVATVAAVLLKSIGARDSATGYEGENKGDAK